MSDEEYRKIMDGEPMCNKCTKESCNDRCDKAIFCTEKK